MTSVDFQRKGVEIRDVRSSQQGLATRNSCCWGAGRLWGSPISANDTQVVSESGLKAGPSLKMRPFADLGWTHGWPTTLTLELFNVQVSSNWPTLKILEATSFDQAQLPADAKEKLLKQMKTVPGCPSGAANWKLITWTL